MKFEMEKKVLLSIFALFFAFAISAQKKKYDYGPDSANCVMNISLYEGFFEQKIYKDAIGPWRKCIELCPKSRKSLYINGVKMMRHYIKQAADSTIKMEYVDSLMWVYDKRIESFGQAGYVLGRKGVDHFKHFKDIDPYASYLILKESVELQKENSEAVVLSSYYNAMYKAYRADKVEKSDLLTEYLVVSDYINYNIRNLEKEKKIESYSKAKNNLDEFFIKLAQCEDVVEVFMKKVADNPDDFELKKKALKVMNRRECDENDFYLNIAKDVHSKEPSAESAYAIAMKEAKNKNFSVSNKYFEEAVSLCGECDDKVLYLLKAGQTASAVKSYSEARSYARKVLEIEPNNGNAYLLIGDSYAGGARNCDDGKAGVYSGYWLAVDYYSKARSVDSSVSEKANMKINSCAAQYPTTADMFMFGLSSGSSYTHCNGETTTVRLKN